MHNKALYGTAGVSVLLAAVAVNYNPLFAQNAVDSVIDTSTAVTAAGWADNVTITIDSVANTARIQSNGIPSHGFAEKYLIPTDPTNQPFSNKPAEFFNVVNSADFFKESDVDTTITTLPIYSEAVTDTSLGRIGIAISGAQIFNDYEDMQRAVVAQDDQVIHDHVPFLDECNGHTLVDGTDYHYHGIPVCIAEATGTAGEHSLMIGVLEDGFPVYSNQGENGVIMTNADLDECSGHFGVTPEFPEGIYHYHLTADEAPYMIDCYHGEIEVTAKEGPGGPPDFNAVAEKLGISESTLKEALGTSRPPDFAAAADVLGISEDALRAAMPKPPGQ